MNRTIGQAVLLGLVAALAMRLGPQSPQRGNVDGANESGRAPENRSDSAGLDHALEPLNSDDPERLVEEYYSTQHTKPPHVWKTFRAALSHAAGIKASDEKPPSPAQIRALRAATDSHGIHLRFLILSVPDPVDSNLGSFTDVILDGLQRAAERQGYLFDRYWLPWSPAPEDRTIDPGVPMKTATDVPGLILFRSSGSANDLLAVFAIGETPTTGVNKVALRRALDFVSYWQDPQPTRSDTPSSSSLHVHLLAPFFSGAAASIRLAICEWFKNWSESDHAGMRVMITCLSGSASATSNKSTLEFDEAGNRANLSVTFHATVIPDSVIREVVLRHLSNQGIGRRQIAFLTEADTTFGEQLLDQQDKQGKGRQSDDVLQVPFPMHISAMRSAYDKDSRLLTGRPRDFDNAPKSNLDLSLGDIRQTPQQVPSFSPTTISSVERSIAHILLSLSRRGVRCIGIIATDVRDQLFLAEQVNFYCPDVQLVLFRADSMFTHPDVKPALEGALVATTYPLFSKNQKWTALDLHSASRRISFTNVAAEGVYNATLALAALDDPRVCNTLDSGATDDGRLHTAMAHGVPFEPIEYRTPFDDIRDGSLLAPPVWLTVISNGEFWPVDVYPRHEWQELERQQLSSRAPAGPCGSKPAGDASGSTNDGQYVLRAVPPKQPSDRYHAPSRTFGDPELENGLRGMMGLLATAYSAFCLASAVRYLAGPIMLPDRASEAISYSWWPVPYFLSLLAAEISLASPALIHFALWWSGVSLFGFESDNWRRTLVLTSVLLTEHLTIWALVAAIAVGTVLTARRNPPGQKPAPAGEAVKQTVPRSIFAALILEVIAISLISGSSVPLSQKAIFLERAARFGDRVTPTLPCFFAGVATACWFRAHLQRQLFAHRFPLLNPFAHASTAPRQLDYAGLAALMRPITECLESSRGWPWPGACEGFTWRGIIGYGFATVSSVLAWHTLIVFPVLFLMVAWAHSLAVYERPAFYFMVWLTWIGVVLLFWLMIWKFLWGAYKFIELLRRLGAHPAADAFTRLPNNMRKALRWLLLAGLPRRFELETSLRIWRSLQNAVPRLLATSNNALLRTQLEVLKEHGDFQKAEATEQRFAGWLDQPQPGARQHRRAEFEDALSKATAPLLPMLANLWQERFEAKQRKLLGKEASHCGFPKGRTAQAYTPEERRWLCTAESLVALQMGTFFRQVFSHLRRLLLAALLIMVFLLASMASYNFQPRRMLVAFSWALVAAFIVAAVTPLVQLNRNALLSRISGTRPDQITWNLGLVASLGAYALIPILSALSFQFPQVGRLTFFVSDALLHAFR